MNAGDLRGKATEFMPMGAEEPCCAEVRAAVVASKPGNAGGAKGGRKANRLEARVPEDPSAAVPPLADKQAEEDLWQRHKAQRGVWSEKMLWALTGGRKGKPWFSLIDKVWAERTLALAWEQVRANAGAAGVDRISVERFAQNSRERLLAVKEQLQQGLYQPQPVKRVWIPKAGSKEQRPLGIPTVLDRVVQSALRMVIEPIFEIGFSERSYGFRPGRSAKGALRRVEELLRSGRTCVVDLDIKGYFDNIPQQALLRLIQEHVADGRVLQLLEGFLASGVMEDRGLEKTESGTPQGGVISPLLANIYLNPLDWVMQQCGLEMVRYADDMVVMCRNEEEGRQALALLGRWMEDAGLTLHAEKTRLVDMTVPGSHFDFLGYRFVRTRKGRLTRLVRPKSLAKLRERVRGLTSRVSGESLETIITRINPILKGWYGYFQQAGETALREVDQWVRGRLRSILRRRQGRRGVAKGQDHQRWQNCYFHARGLFSLIEARARQLDSLRHGAKG